MALLMRALPLVLAGCGLGAGLGGGSDNLPNGGVGPYGKLLDERLVTPIDEPYVIVDVTANLADPSALRDGDAYRLWFSRTPRAGGATAIWYAEVPATLDREGSLLTVALVADQPYEEGAVRAPSVIADGDELRMYYQTGGGDVALAISADDGASWQKQGVVLADAEEPSVVRLGGEWLLYFTRPATEGIHVAPSADGRTFLAPEAVLLPADSGFAAGPLSSPGAFADVGEAGLPRVWLFYRGGGDGAGIGYAGSRDGLDFTRGASGEPVLVPASPDDRGPAPVVTPTGGILFYGAVRATVQVIGAARTGDPG